MSQNISPLPHFILMLEAASSIMITCRIDTTSFFPSYFESDAVEYSTSLRCIQS